MKKYNWPEIQESYNNGMSWRQLEKKFGVTQRALSKAKSRGDLITTRNVSDALKLQYKNGRLPNKPNKDFCDQLSISQSLENRGGRSKWFEVSGIKVQGTWERDIAEKLDELSVRWTKIRNFPFRYLKNNKVHRYSPDFYLPDFDCYLEIKGYWWGNDREKMSLVRAQNPDKKIIVIEKDEYKRIMQGEQVWSFMRLSEEQQNQVRFRDPAPT